MTGADAGHRRGKGVLGIITAVARFVVACVALAACAQVSNARGLTRRPEDLDAVRQQMRASDGGRLEEERLDCPVHCARQGNLVSCRAECPPLVTRERAR
jgi:hypothetical protein